MGGIAETLASNHLFQVQEYGGMFTPVQAALFQTLVVNIMFVSCGSRHNLKTALALLNT